MYLDKVVLSTLSIVITNINWIVAGQPDGRRLNVIKSFYVKFERKIPALVADFCSYYASHRNKTVAYYYDATALGSNYAVNEQDFRWVVVHDCSCQRGRAELVPAMPSAAELDHR